MKSLINSLKKMSLVVYEDDGDLPEFETEAVAFLLSEAAARIDQLEDKVKSVIEYIDRPEFEEDGINIIHVKNELKELLNERPKEEN